MRSGIFIFVIFEYIGSVYLSKQRCMCEDKKYFCIYIDRTYFKEGKKNNLIFTRNLFDDSEVVKSNNASSTEEEILNKLTEISLFGSDESSKNSENDSSLSSVVSGITRSDELSPHTYVCGCKSPEGCSVNREDSSLHLSQDSLDKLNNESGSETSSQYSSYRTNTPPNSEANSQSSDNSYGEIQEISLNDTKKNIQSNNTGLSNTSEDKLLDRCIGQNKLNESDYNRFFPNRLSHLSSLKKYGAHSNAVKPLHRHDSHFNSRKKSKLHKKSKSRSSEKYFSNYKNLSTSSEISSSSDEEYQKFLKTRQNPSSLQYHSHKHIHSHSRNTDTFKSRKIWLRNRFHYIDRRHRHILTRLEMLRNFNDKQKIERNLLDFRKRIQVLYKKFSITIFSKENQFLEFENDLFYEENFMTDLEIALCDLEIK